ncbi:uncharacterized protein LOC112906247, partial [Agrilus planipennis]|uniref:Uncharacterized protein LOC112906247 n=1 Tax=Agrilus planipennis TaxID=224129 RepID=A0A7F5RIP1_AGRPL
MIFHSDLPSRFNFSFVCCVFATTYGQYQHERALADLMSPPVVKFKVQVEMGLRERTLSWPTIPPQNVSGDSRSSALGGVDPLLPSPASHSAVIVSPETLSHHSSPAKIPSVTTASVSTVKQGPAHVQISSTQ